MNEARESEKSMVFPAVIYGCESWTIKKAKSKRIDPLEKEMATHSSILACKIPWTKEHDGLQSMGSQRVGHG